MNEIIISKTRNLLKENICAMMLTEYIQFQSNIETRKDSDKSSTEKTVKKAFDTMLNNGDITILSWDAIDKKLIGMTYQKTKDVKFKREKNYTLDLMDTISSTNLFNGHSISAISEMGMEDISAMNIKLDSSLFDSLLLINTASKLIEQANINLEKHRPAIKEISLNIINKYNKLFSQDFISYMEKSI